MFNVSFIPRSDAEQYDDSYLYCGRADSVISIIQISVSSVGFFVVNIRS